MIAYLKKRKARKKTAKKIGKALFETGFGDTKFFDVRKCEKNQYKTIINMELPETKSLIDLRRILPLLQQHLTALDGKIFTHKGTKVVLHFGTRDLGNEPIYWNEKMLRMNTLELAFPSSYGLQILDFEDGASCHMLAGGASRTGKTVFLIFLATTLYLQMKGEILIFISSVKAKDFYPFKDVRNVKITQDKDEFENILDDIQDEYDRRNRIINDPRYKHATDTKSVRKYYPEILSEFKPIFVIVDEYAQYADSPKIQEKVMKLAEVSGHLNCHLCLSSQRPDAKNVLKPRIKANCLVRFAFRTSDRTNSEIILDRWGAESIPSDCKGRGILIDGDATTVQVPLLEPIIADNLLEPYRDVKNSEKTRFNDSDISGQIQSNDEKSTGLVDLSEQFQSNQHDKQSLATYEPVFFNPTDTEN